MDSIYIDRLKVSTNIGITEVERSQKQTLHISTELFTDTRKAGASDNIADTIDYAAVCNDIQEVTQTEYHTIEALAEAIASMIVRRYSPSEGVKVVVWKYILPDTQGVSVTIFRS